MLVYQRVNVLNFNKSSSNIYIYIYIYIIYPICAKRADAQTISNILPSHGTESTVKLWLDLWMSIPVYMGLS